MDPDENFFNQIYKGISGSGSEYYSISYVENIIGRNQFSLLFLNIRSFHKNYDSFQAASSAAGMIPDTLVLTETWLKEPVDIEGYTPFILFAMREGVVECLFLRKNPTQLL